jgi:hypothetical protein
LLHINEETAHKKIISGTKITEVKNFVKILNKLKFKWGKPSGKNGARLTRSGGGSIIDKNTCMEYIHMRLEPFKTEKIVYDKHWTSVINIVNVH